MAKKSQAVEQTAVSKSEPWAAQQPYLTKGFEEAEKLYDAPGPGYYPESTVVPFSQESEQGMGAVMDQAGAGGNPLIPQASGELSKTMAGEYLGDSNPYLAGIADRIGGDVRRHTDSQFGMAGRAGSGAHAESLGRGISMGVGQMYGNAYESERGRMMGAAGMAPGMAGAASKEAYGDASAMMGVGAMKEGQSGNELQDLMNRYSHEQNLPQSKLQQYLQNISGNYGGTNTTTTSQPMSGGSRIGGALGGAATGAQMGSLVGMPWLGAGVGGLMGAFG